MTTQKKWLSIVDYSNLTELSISTVRRRIRNKKVVYKKQNGKFFILCEGQQFSSLAEDKENLSELSSLQEENRKLKELIAEQEMLIKLYEERLTNKQESTLSHQQIWGNYTPELSQ